MNYEFSDHTRKVLAMAREEAIRLRHGYVGTEHIVLGLLREGEGRGARVLIELGLDARRLEKTVEDEAGEGRERAARGELPYTRGAKNVLKLAMAAARDLEHDWVGTEHLLLGLIGEEQGIAAEVLDAAGVTVEEVQPVVARMAREEGRPRTSLWRSRSELVAARSELAASMRAAVTRATRRRGRATLDREVGGGGAEEVWFLEIDQDSDVPLYEQIIARIEEAVATGRLAPGERLTSVRDLSAELGIAPGTVARAYSELETRGVVRTEGARGTHVSADPPGRTSPGPDPSFLERLLKKPIVAAFHRGATAQQMREALERAMKGILGLL